MPTTPAAACVGATETAIIAHIAVAAADLITLRIFASSNQRARHFDKLSFGVSPEIYY